MNDPIVLPGDECDVMNADWGQLTWFANRKLGNSGDVTVGRCIIKPGCSNPVHSHPNCAEVLVVISGKIAHSIGGGKDAEMSEGDVVTVPANFVHRAKNIGTTDAVLFIVFTSADRQVKGE